MACMPLPVVSVDESQDGGHVKVRPRGMLRVKLPAQLGTGFGWQHSALSLLEPVKSEVAPRGNGRPGATEDQIFTFSASHIGDETVTFEYRRPWEKDTAPARRFSISVTVTAE